MGKHAQDLLENAVQNGDNRQAAQQQAQAHLAQTPMAEVLQKAQDFFLNKIRIHRSTENNELYDYENNMLNFLLTGQGQSQCQKK
jgi:hypothetical protein